MEYSGGVLRLVISTLFLVDFLRQQEHYQNLRAINPSISGIIMPSVFNTASAPSKS